MHSLMIYAEACSARSGFKIQLTSEPAPRLPQVHLELPPGGRSRDEWVSTFSDLAVQSYKLMAAVT